ncbi:MAG TPA: phosphoribosylamine--glycine ligase [Vicinamibacterales bacterium]|nr:phosphoribosylamine--glycine ligase [Vicinamibacterales bacterium]
MKVLVLGSGGREHALVWRLSRDPNVAEILTAPGNPGTSAIGRNVNVDLMSPKDVLALAAREKVDLTVVGPEAPLESGVADLFRSHGRPIVGPSKRGAALECSKAHAKAFMSRHGIPTARFAVCDTAESALAAVSGARFGFPVVVKADGLAAGKGVTVAADRAEAEAAVRAAMVDKQFGAAGSRVVIEECLSGPEVSLFFLCDGEHASYLGSAQDHKRIFDDDRGPNTGGMGAFAPSPLATLDLVRDTYERIVQPVVDGHAEMGEPYRGFLYVSLMLTADGAKVIEFNVRFGDPEAQVVLPLIDGGFAGLLRGAAEGAFVGPPVVSPDKTVGVVLASRGYPASAESGVPIDGVDRAAELPGVTVFHAGTKMQDGRLVTAGGRVLTVVGRGATYREAMDRAYAAVREIRFDGMQYRTDIGKKAIGT